MIKTIHISCSTLNSIFFQTIILFLLAGNLHSQTAPVKNLDFFVNKTASEYDEEKKRTFIYRLLGDQVKSSVTIMPIATHIFSGVDLELPWYIAANYKGFEITSFINTYNDVSFGLNYKRKWVVSSKFSINYSIGILYGYGDNLAKIEGFPLGLKSLVENTIVPVVGLDFVFKVAYKVALQGSLAPNVFLLGIRYYL